LFFYLEQALAFKHHGEDERGGGVTRIILLDELAQVAPRKFPAIAR
jgi:hypothetical protein